MVATIVVASSRTRDHKFVEAILTRESLQELTVPVLALRKFFSAVRVNKNFDDISKDATEQRQLF